MRTLVHYLLLANFWLIYYLKVEVTKYEELEEVHAEVKLKQLLWDSLDQWDQTVQDWMVVRTLIIARGLLLGVVGCCKWAKELFDLCGTVTVNYVFVSFFNLLVYQ